jgi:hypothetical protein
MDSDRNTDTGTETNQTRTTDDERGVGDDERENRRQIAQTGEPQRDSLGNADGAS